MNDLSDDTLRPDFDTRAAVSLGCGYRGYNLWYSRYPWSLRNMFYRMSLRRVGDKDEDGVGCLWIATVGFTYLSECSGRLEAELEGMRIHERQSARIDEVEEEDGRISRYVAIEVSLESDELDDSFAIALSDVLARFIEDMTPVVDEHRVHYKARNETLYELLALEGSAESVVGSLTWNRSEGSWSYETSDRLISGVLEGVIARGCAKKRESLITESTIAELLVPIDPTDRRFVEGLADELEQARTCFFELREVTGR